MNVRLDMHFGGEYTVATVEQVKELRSLTGAGVMECRKALDEAGGDFDKAVEVIRERGAAAAAKKMERVAKDGIIGHYIHAGSRVAALVEVNCETDFVAKTADFQGLAHDLAMQVVATNPLYVRPEDVPAEVIEQEKATYRAGADASKPPAVIEKIVEGKLAKFYEETCLLNQPFIKDCDTRVGDLLTQMIARVGENIVVRRFVRYALGE